MPGTFSVITLNHGSFSSMLIETTNIKVDLHQALIGNESSRFMVATFVVFYQHQLRDLGIHASVVVPITCMLCNHTSQKVAATAEVDEIFQ